MFKIMNVLCLVSVVALTGDIMLYFCKDIVKVFNQSMATSNKVNRNSNNGVRRESKDVVAYSYQNKIAK